MTKAPPRAPAKRKPATGATVPGKRAAARVGAAKIPNAPTPAKAPARSAPKARQRSAAATAAAVGTRAPAAPARAALTASERDRRFNLILQTACLKAGSAAAVSTISSKIPLLKRFAPALMGNVTETLSLGRLQHQLVRDTLDLYDLDLSDLEEKGVILLATAGSLGSQQLSRQMVDQLVKQLGGRYLSLLTTRALPLASLVGEIAAAIASTYAVGKRAQVLCNLPGTGARNLGDLLRGLTGIDQRRLLSWSAEALKLALTPFRSVLALIPGAR